MSALGMALYSVSRGQMSLPARLPRGSELAAQREGAADVAGACGGRTRGSRHEARARRPRPTPHQAPQRREGHHRSLKLRSSGLRQPECFEVITILFRGSGEICAAGISYQMKARSLSLFLNSPASIRAHKRSRTAAGRSPNHTQTSLPSARAKCSGANQSSSYSLGFMP